jgi:hypothetical protein
MVELVVAALGAVANGMAGEAGKRALEATGARVRALLGREVAAPTTPAACASVAALLVEACAGRPELLVEFVQLTRSLADAQPLVPAGTPRLPAAPEVFTDRSDVIKRLDAVATRPFDGRPRTARLHGPEGIGTTALAVHWGWRHADRFPDGQPYADLRGRTAEEAPAVLLRALGIPDDRIPATAAGRADALRTLVTGRRLLIVLDHVSSAAQIEPLLLTEPGVCTVVISRDRIGGPESANLPLGPLPAKYAKRLVTAVAGKQAVAAAKAQLPGLLARCDGSPYALHAAAHRLRTAPPDAQEAPVSEPENPVVAAADDTYRRLGPEAARLYRLTGLHPWPALDAAAAAAIARCTRESAETLLAELADARLLERTAVGRYRHREGVRVHAVRAAATTDGISACSAALCRAVDHFERRAVSAARGALKESWRTPAPTSADPETYPDPGTALAMLVDEADNLVAAVTLSQETGDLPYATVSIARALWPLQLKAGLHEKLLPALRTGVEAAEAQYPDSRDAASLHFQLAFTLAELKRIPEAEAEARAAARAEQAAGHLRGWASAVELLGLLRLTHEWRYADALACFDEAGDILDGIGPDTDGYADLSRARALLERHRGRALNGSGRRAEAVRHLGTALEFFRSSGDRYNAARTLTDLAWTRYADGERAELLPLIDEALDILRADEATYHVLPLEDLRRRCVS